MDYREWPGLEPQISLLGFGCMRFPTTAAGTIDEPAATAMLESAKAAGVNYFDTAWFYHKHESEPFMGRVLSGWARDSFYLATKMPTSIIKSLEQAKEIFAQQLARLQVDYFDFYLLHNLNHNVWPLMDELGVLDFLLEMQHQGKIRHLGFSFHDNYEVFTQIMARHKWDFCQLQLNYMDVDEQAGLKGYQLAESQGVPVVIMEPVKGGALAALPDEVTSGFRALHPEWSTASWAIRWTASLPNVMTILSGMTTPEQVADNLATLNQFTPLTAQEQRIVTETAALIRARVYNSCTDCKYCMPCPAGVDIPGNFRIWNRFGMYQNRADTTTRWNDLKHDEKAACCISCGKCEKVCPQQLKIPQDLARLQTELDALI